MAIKLNVDQTAETVANCKKVMNSDILDLFQSVAGKLAEAGDNEVSAQLLECCKNFQTTFNSFTESATAAIKEFEKVEEINERVKKLDIGVVSATDASFGIDALDTSLIN